MPVQNDPLPLFPLSTVLYPQGLLPLRIFEARYIDMISASLRNGSAFGVVPIVRGAEVGTSAEFHPCGTRATVAAWDQGQDGLLHIQVEGGARFRVQHYARQPNGLVVGSVASVEAESEDPIAAEFDYLRRLLSEVFEQNRAQVPYQDWQLDSALWVAHRLAEILPLTMCDRIAILEAASGSAKLRLLDTRLTELENSPASRAQH